MKRYTETAKWLDSWFLSLSALTRFAWLYICEACDQAGVWDKNTILAEFQMGIKIDWDVVLKELGEKRIEVLPSGKWFIRYFISFQQSVLHPHKAAHKQILALLDKHQISIASVCHPNGRSILLCLGHSHGLSPEEGSGEKPTIPENLQTPKFLVVWNEWYRYRRSLKSVKDWNFLFSKQLAQLSQWGEEKAIAALNNSMMNSWVGIFEPKMTSGASRGAPASDTVLNTPHRCDSVIEACNAEIKTLKDSPLSYTRETDEYGISKPVLKPDAVEKLSAIRARIKEVQTIKANLK